MPEMQAYVVEAARPLCPHCFREAAYLFRPVPDPSYPYTRNVRCVKCIEAGVWA